MRVFLSVSSRLGRPLLVAAVFLLSACATVYTSADFAGYQQRHRVLAILPATVSINAQSFAPGTESSIIEQQQEEEAWLFQRQLYAQFLKQYAKSRYTVEFQDVDQTNALLEKAGIQYRDLRSKSRSELGQLLGVDAVVGGRIYRDRPMGTGAAVFSVLVAGASLTNEVQISMTVHDVQSGRLVWNYDHLVGGGLISSAEGMAKSLMKGISKKFPYERKSAKAG